jgi:hypothetical protein
MGHSHSVGAFVLGCLGGFEIFPGSVSVRYSAPNHTSQECFLEVSIFGFCSTLLFCRARVINFLRRKYSASLNMPRVCTSVMICVSMYIMDLLEMISIQMITLGTDSGGLGFTTSLA